VPVVAAVNVVGVSVPGAVSCSPPAGIVAAFGTVRSFEKVSVPELGVAPVTPAFMVTATPNCFPAKRVASDRGTWVASTSVWAATGSPGDNVVGVSLPLVTVVERVRLVMTGMPVHFALYTGVSAKAGSRRITPVATTPIIPAVVAMTDAAAISVSADENESEWKEFVAQKNMSWPQYRDADGRVRRAFQVESFPTYLVIDGDGIIKQRIVGLNPQETVVHSLKATLAAMPQVEGTAGK